MLMLSPLPFPSSKQNVYLLLFEVPVGLHNAIGFVLFCMLGNPCRNYLFGKLVACRRAASARNVPKKQLFVYAIGSCRSFQTFDDNV